MKNVYWISYEIRTRENGRKMEENSFLAKMSPANLSVQAVKDYVLGYHGYDPQQHYVRIINWQNLGQVRAQGGLDDNN